MPTLTSRTKSWRKSALPADEVQARENGFARIIGIDPGLSATGFGIIERNSVLDFGVIRTDNGANTGERLLHLVQELEKVLKKYSPDLGAIESLFFKGGGARSVILSAESRGALLFTLAKRNIPVFELTPATIKLAITGSGRASKSQLNYMVRQVLKISQRIPEHAADALAVAYCLRNRLKM